MAVADFVTAKIREHFDAEMADALTAEDDEFGENTLRDWLINEANSPTGWFHGRLGL